MLIEGPSRTDPSVLRGRTRGNKAVNFTGAGAPGELVSVVIDSSTSQTLAGRRRSSSRRLTMLPAVAIFGPTASGKSAVALELAGRLDGEIVSCDAMQAYRGLPILTNQPSPDELAAIPHHLVGTWPLEHAGSVAEFGRLAHAAVDDVIARGRRPVLAGGSGLYLRAAVAELRPQPPPAAG